MTTAATSGQTMTLTVNGAALGETRSFAIHFSQGEIDATSRDSARWGEFLKGRREWTIDFEGLFIYNNVAKKIFQSYFTAATPTTLTIILTMPDTATYTGTCLLTSMDYDGPAEDAVTISGSLKGTGALVASVS